VAAAAQAAEAAADGKERNTTVAKLTGKVALVTGASRGIGKAVALAYAKEGAKVFICARRRAPLTRAAREIRAAGGKVSYLAADLANARAAQRLVNAARRRYGTIHILVNNASLLGPRVPIAKYPLAEWEKVLKVNLTAMFVLTKEALRLMIPQKEGSIINVSSGVGRVGKARWGAYAVSKFGVEGLTQVLADEMKELNIRVNSVNPGGTRTEMRAAAYPDEDPLTLPQPEEITGVFLYLAAPESAGVTGKSFDARDWLDKR
jgi:NAD(P)-dependent dehydrogenase (short-subunit alcohol dehydrogenase family)